MADFIEPQMVKIIHQKPEKTMTIEMVHLPKGRFMMGEESEVNIDYEFEIGKFPVTVEEYMIFVEDTNKYHPKWLEKDNNYGISYEKDSPSPIVGVNWYDAGEYCKWLTKKSSDNYRLIKSTEWEYALGIREIKNENINTWGIYNVGFIREWCLDSAIIKNQSNKYQENKIIRTFEYGRKSSDFRDPNTRDLMLSFRIVRTLP